MRAFMRRPAGRAADRRLLVPDTSDSMIVLHDCKFRTAVSGVCLSLSAHARQLRQTDSQLGLG